MLFTFATFDMKIAGVKSVFSFIVTRMWITFLHAQMHTYLCSKYTFSTLLVIIGLVL